jgi:hypothetical protein
LPGAWHLPKCPSVPGMVSWVGKVRLILWTALTSRRLPGAQSRLKCLAARKGGLGHEKHGEPLWPVPTCHGGESKGSHC